MRFLLFHETIHIIFTAIVSLLLYYKFKNWRLILVAFFVVIFLDVDHLFDYFLYEMKTGILTFPFTRDYFYGSQKVFVFFHGWEWVIPLWFIGKKAGKNLNSKGLEWALILPFLGHLIVDQLFYTSNPFGYFIIYRILTGFNINRFNGNGL